MNNPPDAGRSVPFDEKLVLADYRRNGFALIKGVFSGAEVEDFRERIQKASERPGPAEILSRDELRPILLDDRVLRVVRAVLGPRLVYFGDSTFRNETREIAERGFHQDSKRDDADPSSTEYPLARIGIYLQDHARHSGGLKVRRGSHKHVYIGRKNLRRLFFGSPADALKPASFGLGPGVNIPIEEGDLVIWSLRTWHSGYAVRLKMLPNLCVNPRLEKYIPDFLALPTSPVRRVIFSSFGAPSEALENFIAERLSNPANVAHWKNCRFNDPSIVKECASKGLDLRLDAFDSPI